MSIRNLGIGFIALLSGIILLGAVLILNSSWGAYRDAARGTKLEDLIRAEFGMLAAIAVERGATYQTVVLPNPVSPALLEEIRKNRAALDNAWPELERHAAVDPGLAARLTEVRQRIAAARSGAEANWSKPKAERPADLANTVLGAIGEATAAIDSSLVASLKTAGSVTPQAGDLLAIAMSTWRLRQAASSGALTYGALAGEKRAATPQERDGLNFDEGRVQQAWSDIRDRGDQASAPAALRAAIAAVRVGYFDGNQALRQRILKAATGQGEFDLPVTEWRANLVAEFARIMTIRDAALDAARDIAEADEARALRNVTLAAIAAAVVLLIAAAVGTTFIRRIARPIVRLSDVMTELAAARDITVPYRGRRDEIGHMAAAVEVFKDSMTNVQRLSADSDRARVASEAQRSALERLTGDFVARIDQVVRSITSSASALRSNAETLSTNADQTTEQSSTAAAASEQASSNVQTVAAATEELSSSISEISRRVSESAEIARAAAGEANATAETVNGLAEAASRIGAVIKLIEDIAAQTNLLALNATIEAARAGEAGKGFAVVAGEVKLLAGQTAKATEEIASQVDAIRSATAGTVDAITRVGTTIGRINEIATGISAAVEQQGAATQEIARNVQQASAGAAQVSDSIRTVATVAVDTGKGAARVTQAADALLQQASDLRTDVDGFVAQLKSA